MHINISHTLPQWLGFSFLTAMDAVFVVLFFCISWKLLRTVLRHGPDQPHSLLLPDRRPATPKSFYFRLTLALTSLLITTFFFAYLLAATTNINNTLSSWRLHYDSPCLIMLFIIEFTIAAAIAHTREFSQGRSHLSVGLSAGVYFGLNSPIFVYVSIARVLEGRSMLPNDILCLGTLPITVILVGFGIKGYRDSQGTDELQDVVGEAA